MAIVNAVASGNYSNYAVTFGGIEPQPGDTVRANSFTVTIDIPLDSIILERNAFGAFQITQTQVQNNGGLLELTNCDVYNQSGSSHALNLTHTSGLVTLRDAYGAGATGGWSAIGANSTGSLVLRNAIGGASSGYGVTHNGNGEVTCENATAPAAGYGIVKTGNGTLNVTNAYSGGANNGVAIYIPGGGNIFVQNAFGGFLSTSSLAPAISNNGSGYVYVENAYAGNASSSRAVDNTGSGFAIITNAIGNDYGPGGTNIISYAVSGSTNSSTSRTFVKRLVCGPYGALPVSGAVFIDPSIDNVFQFRLAPNGATKTLIDSSINSQVPDPDDVRLGTVYDNGDKIGACAVPLPGQTLLGVPVDNTVGTAVLTEDQVPTPEQISEAVHTEDLRTYEETPHTLAWALKVITQAISTYNQQRQKAFLTDIAAKRGKKSGGGNPAWFLEKEGATVIVPTSFEPDPNTYRDNYYYNAKTNALYVKIITKYKDNTAVASWKQVSQ